MRRIITFAFSLLLAVGCSGNNAENNTAIVTTNNATTNNTTPTNNPAGGCDGLAEGASRCTGDVQEVCALGSIRSSDCGDGKTCSAGACACDLAMDGVCVTGCGEDPDCAACVPDCTGKTCGPDGCAEMCGECIGDDVCLEGNCVSTDGWCAQSCGPEDDPGAWADDGECDDGGDGGDQFCAYGTDCGDCGVREPLPVRCELNYNDDCPPDQRCDCNEATAECLCVDGVRGSGAFGSDCTAQHDCASGLCLNDKCSRPCNTGDDCGDPLDQCQPTLGLCVEGPCEPICQALNRDCGSDGCGGTCGSCMGGGFCAIGQCRQDTPGTVECNGVDGNECGFGEACCLSRALTATCEERGSPRAEHCKDNSADLVYQYIGCDDDTDCLGQVCCADLRRTFCADSCDRAACKIDIPQGQPNGCESDQRCCPIQRYTGDFTDNDTGYCAPRQLGCL